MVNESYTAKHYGFVMPCPAVKEEELNEVEHILSRINNVTLLVCSGSLPVGLSPAIITRFAKMATETGIKFIADTSGEALKLALQNGVYLLKPSLTELCSLVGKKYLKPAEIKGAAQQLINTGRCEVLVISMGPAGALLVTKNEIKSFGAPVVKKVSTVGAGDSMVAGISWRLESGQSLEEAVKFGVACGTTANINSGTQLFKKADVLRFYDWMKEEDALPKF